MNHSTTPRLRRRATALIAAATMALVSCGGSDDDSSSEATADETADPAGLTQIAPVDVAGEPLAPYGETPDDAAIGSAAPVATGQSFDGSQIVIGGPTENPTFVVFLAHWCPACNAEIPELVELAESDGYPDGLDVVGVATATTDQRDNFPPSEWFDDAGWPFPVMADSGDSAAFVNFGGTSFPFAVVLDTDGTVLARTDGVKSGEETVAFLEAALATA